MPPLIATGEPITVLPDLKVTVPVSVPATAELTVAVSVTEAPKVEGLAEVVSTVVEVAGLTVKLTGADVEVAKSASPEYTAVRLCVPVGKAVVTSAAVPPLTATGEPITVVPDLKVTVPVLVPVTAELTVAVSVTEAPKVEGLAEVVSTVVEVAVLTVKLTGADVEVVKLVSPEYTAVRFCVPPSKAVVIRTAVPPLTATGEPITVVPDLKVTVPLGDPPNCGLMVAVSVADCPNVEGLAEVVSTVVVLALLTTCGVPVSVPVLPLKLALPPKVAVMGWFPTASVEMLKMAGPSPSAPLPIIVPLSKKVTVPDEGPPPPGATTETLALNVMR